MKKKFFFLGLCFLLTLSISALTLTKTSKVETVSGTLLANMEALACGECGDEYWHGSGGNGSFASCYVTRSNSETCTCSGSRPNPGCELHFGLATRGLSCRDCFSIEIISGAKNKCKQY